MQNYSDLSLKCCDCDSTFTSATKLLQHFAEHVHREIKGRFKASYRSRKKKSSSGEVSMSQGESGSESSQTVSVSDSCSESRESDQPQPCKLAKFDLQKRLETCVSNLSTPIDSVEQEWNCESNVETKVSEDYSPLKFCMITMEENDNKPDVISPKKGPSRKQLLPKKIERKMDRFKKLAPKPEGLLSQESPLQSSGKKKYACHLCTKVFGWSTDLKRHILVHTGERPFKCKTCQATFTRNFLLQKHQSKVHPCKPKEVEVKPEIIEMPNFVENSDEDVKIEVDPIKEEPIDDNDFEDDEDDDRLVITNNFMLQKHQSKVHPCKPREVEVKPEIIEMPNFVENSNEDVKVEVDPINEEPIDDNDFEDDEDDDRLVITEDVEEKPSLSNCSTDTKWHMLPTNADRRCSDLKQSDLFSIAPVKV